MEINDHFFRREAGHLVSALTRIFGVHNLALAEDVVQDAFCRALETWPMRGVPDNPSAWLMATARNRALDVLRRQRTATTFAPELGRLLDSEWTLAPVVNDMLAADALQDSMLRMMFSCCHPRLSEPAQVALVLNILCGFSIDEIARACMIGQAAIEKRIQRGKSALAHSKRLFDTALPADFSDRLPAVQRALYLLFNEGYHGASPETPVRLELCNEAIRLVALLLRNPLGKTPATYALAALMSLTAARLPARTDFHGNLVPLYDQDRSQWDRTRVSEGIRLLELSASGSELTTYHLEAAMASVHAMARHTSDTDWRAIIGLYDQLMRLNPSPIVALNRAIAIAQQDGPERGIAEIQAIPDPDRLAAYPFYPAALGELEFRRGNDARAHEHFELALARARNPMERRFFEHRLAACGSDNERPANVSAFWEPQIAPAQAADSADD
jgi:RNA polymerase sigma-70 factor (ECF subfamily)